MPCDLANMFNLLISSHALSEISPNRTLKDLHHEGEHGASQGSVPPSLRSFVTDECMLCLHFQELLIRARYSVVWTKKEVGAMTYASSNVSIF